MEHHSSVRKDEPMNVATFVVVTLLSISPVAQSRSTFGTCGYWQDQKATRDKSPAASGVQQGYRVGFAHGFVLGIDANLPPYISSSSPAGAAWQALEDAYMRGYEQALMRPAFLIDAFDQKCSDYRNRAARLSDIGLIVLVEVGGIPADRINHALELMRERRDGYLERVLRVLMGGTR
jgi:hypothetical protein